MNLNVRRATIEDLPTLRGIWASMQFSPDDLEKRLKEFQVAEVDGQVTGAIGMQIAGQYALLHSEGFSDYSAADRAREVFWDRIRTLAANHGVFRLWGQEMSPFWFHVGFERPVDDDYQRLPEQWRGSEGQWYTLQLKDEDAVTIALGQRFAGFMDSEKKQTAEISEKARTLRSAITIIGFAVFFMCMAYLFYRLTHGQQLFPRP